MLAMTGAGLSGPMHAVTRAALRRVRAIPLRFDDIGAFGRAPQLVRRDRGARQRARDAHAAVGHGRQRRVRRQMASIAMTHHVADAEWMAAVNAAHGMRPS